MIPPTLFFLLILALLSPPSLSDDYLGCSLHPYQCGSGTYDIRYPFRLHGSPPYCGLPQFGDLYCSAHNESLLTTISGTEYRVNQIDYTRHLLRITDLSVLASPDPYSCPRPPSTNISLTSAPFNYTGLDSNLTIYFNCKLPGAFPFPSPLHNITCSQDAYGYTSFYRLPGEPPPPADVWDVCDSMVIVPVNRTVAATDFAEAIRGGFGLTWKADDAACDKCMKSNGICGNNPGSGAAEVCLCSNSTSIDGGCVPIKESKKHRKSTIIIVIGAGAGGALILGCCIFLLYNRRKKQRQASLSNLLSRSTSSKISSKKDPELGDTSYHTHIFSYDELEEATNGFNVSRELGDGGFGTVYKGKLRDGRTVAVKRLYENNYRRLEQFMNEVKILSSLRHQNLVTLYGCTSRHSRELLLVYEYIPNGTLADHLHGHLASDRALPWPVRMSIAIETADALAYLHAVEPQIIHRDVKTNNILLDSSFHVKVADFGLSRLFPLDATHVSTAPQGTPGYVDPEYHQCYQLTDKSDVYSFGVVLVELISSKPAVDISRHRHEINLSNMAITKIQNCQIDQLVDPELGYQSHPEIMGMINQVAELAFRCLQPDREMRPGIKEVLEVLKALQGGGNKAEKEAEVAEVQVKEETRLLKTVSPFSPDSVTERWSSRLTTPNTST